MQKDILESSHGVCGGQRHSRHDFYRAWREVSMEEGGGMHLIRQMEEGPVCPTAGS